MLAADSRGVHAETGIVRVTKLFRRRVGRREHLIAVCGDFAAAMVYLDWYGSKAPLPDALRHISEDERFGALLVIGKQVFEVDRFCRPVEIEDRFCAIGTGAQAAMGAMHAGATAIQAVVIACKVDQNSGLPVVSLSTREMHANGKTNP